ncbi:type II toxin-antitoxin system VapC family toxin [Candidatus Woesearchaeota archaeon]|nr:type II toxin-antitoxin system VapC family toxin [Candidatus Woesearchaeota archaeon]
MEFVESTVLVYAFTNSKWREACRGILGKQGLATDSLAIAEACSKIGTLTGREQEIMFLKSVFRMGNLEILPFDRNLAFSTLRNLKKTPLHFFDCVHYSAAQTFDCSAIYSYDKDFDKLPIKRIEP